MPGDTRLRKLKESAAKHPIYGDPKAVSPVDHWPIEISESNRVTCDPNQSALRLSILGTHATMKAWENRIVNDPKRWRTVVDKLTLKEDKIQITLDSQNRLLDVDTNVMSNQLTIDGESRKVMAGHDIAVSGIGQNEPPAAGLQLLGLGK